MNVVLDTDIGSDVDDLLALTTIFGSPELDLTGVTTVYGDTLLRARMVARSYRAAGKDAPPIIPGRSQPRSGREVWWAGHEGDLMPDLSRETVDTEADAVATLAAAKRVIAIGPLTNLAAAVERDECQIRSLCLMGGDFAAVGTSEEQKGVEHNIRCDIDAAAAVFAAGLPTTIIGIDQTARIRVTEDAVLQIEQAGDFGQLVAMHVRQYWHLGGHPWNVPHDPLAVLMLTTPELFTFDTGTITVAPDGRTLFDRSEHGPHRIVTDLNVDAVTTELTRRFCARWISPG